MHIKNKILSKKIVKLAAIPSILLLSLASWKSYHQETNDEHNDICSARNTAFQSGEYISMNVYYNVIGLYIHAGTASFTTIAETLNNTPVYHVLGQGTSNSKYDWIFKVRDRYETYMDQTTLVPYKFIRNVSEGKYTKYQVVDFNHKTLSAHTDKGNVKIPNCTQDIISAVYNVRNLDFNRYKVNDKIPFEMFLDNEIYHMYVRYLGKEIITTRFGKFRAIKFKPLLLKGEVFKGGEKMVAWVTDDENKIPLRIESPLSVGSIKVDLMNYKNLRHPFSSRIQ